MRMSLTGPRFLKSAAVDQMIRDGVERLRALPGVETASATCCVPLEGGYGLPFLIVGRPLEQGPFHGGGGWTTVSPGYFEVFKIPVKLGRTFTARGESVGPAARKRFNRVSMPVFGGSALLLGAIGIYGLMACSVQQRSQEIGIRMALGAEPGGVRRMVVFQGMRLALLGVVIGIASAFGLTRFISTFSLGFRPGTPWSSSASRFC